MAKVDLRDSRSLTIDRMLNSRLESQADLQLTGSFRPIAATQQRPPILSQGVLNSAFETPKPAARTLGEG